jgi:hypothetical protein
MTYIKKADRINDDDEISKQDLTENARQYKTTVPLLFDRVIYEAGTLTSEINYYAKNEPLLQIHIECGLVEVAYESD